MDRAAPSPTLWSWNRRVAEAAAVGLAVMTSELIVETALRRWRWWPAAGGGMPRVVAGGGGGGDVHDG